MLKSLVHTQTSHGQVQDRVRSGYEIKPKDQTLLKISLGIASKCLQKFLLILDSLAQGLNKWDLYIKGLQRRSSSLTQQERYVFNAIIHLSSLRAEF